MKLFEILPKIKKGRRFKRKHWLSFVGVNCAINFSDLESDDFILEPEVKQISLEQLTNAWMEALPDKRYGDSIDLPNYFDRFKKLLGYSD